MPILEEILDHKLKEVADRQSLFPIKLLERSIYFETPTVSLKKYLLRPDRWGIIAEIKRKSPSRGVINDQVSVERISIGYMQAGASALSVLTDGPFFGGSNEDLITARNYNLCPILRKDFIIDEYQVLEAKSIGADAILLIAAALEPQKAHDLAVFAHSLGLEVVLEVHNGQELDSHINPEVDVVGVNNRDLKTFDVNVQTSKQLAAKIPPDFVKISESGIFEVDTVLGLRELGYQGFLIGQNFMEHSRPEKKCREFIAQLRQQTNNATP
ncbi:MAG: indole-3-glycerol phosphate synthase TrpC [Cyclobacteriaceae bacterium]|nr:indole-3-glycerol phosphate synthase TrpC [Cyclobacteriaceae bacterium]